MSTPYHDPDGGGPVTIWHVVRWFDAQGRRHTRHVANAASTQDAAQEALLLHFGQLRPAGAPESVEVLTHNALGRIGESDRLLVDEWVEARVLFRRSEPDPYLPASRAFDHLGRASTYLARVPEGDGDEVANLRFALEDVHGRLAIFVGKLEPKGARR